jgi:hypothetical protein
MTERRTAGDYGCGAYALVQRLHDVLKVPFDRAKKTTRVSSDPSAGRRRQVQIRKHLRRSDCPTVHDSQPGEESGQWVSAIQIELKQTAK